MKNFLLVIKQNLLIVVMGVASVILVSVGLYLAFRSPPKLASSTSPNTLETSSDKKQTSTTTTDSAPTDQTTSSSGSSTSPTKKTNSSSTSTSTSSTGTTSSSGGTSTGSTGETSTGSTGGTSSGGGGTATPPPSPLSVSSVHANDNNYPGHCTLASYTFHLSASITATGSGTVNYTFYKPDGSQASGSKALNGSGSISTNFTTSDHQFSGSFYVHISWDGGDLTTNTATVAWTGC